MAEMKRPIAKAMLENDGRLGVLHGETRYFVRQKAENDEMFSGIEQSNVYMISTKDGDKILKALEAEWEEESSCMLFANKPFAIDIMDADKKILLKARSTNTTCVSTSITVECPVGHKLATIEKPFSWLKPTFLIKNNSGELMFKIDSPIAAAFGTFDSAVFPIYAHDEKTKLGYISKDWSGLSKELFTDCDAFVLEVPADLDAAWKGVLFSVLFLIDFTFYEQFN